MVQNELQNGEQSDKKALFVFPEQVEFGYEVAELPHVVRICVKVCSPR
jgi:hypothetical protein